MPGEQVGTKEIPNSLRIMVVDDENYVLKATKTRIKEVLGSVSQVEVFSPGGTKDLLEKALLERPDFILLDDDYRYKEDEFRINESDVESVANQFGVNFEPIKKPDRGNATVSGVMPGDLYWPDSINFALLLRFLNYKGKIIICSGAPPETERIQREINRLNEHLEKFGLKSNWPFDGVVTKPDREGHSEWAIEYRTDESLGSYWKFNQSESFPQAFFELMKASFSPKTLPK